MESTESGNGKRRLLAWITGGVSLVVVAVLGLVQWLGPSVGIMLTGSPVFIMKPSEQRYAAVALDSMEKMGIHGGTPEFARARAEAERSVVGADGYEDVWPALDSAIYAAGGKHSRVLRPEVAEQSSAADTEPEVADIAVDDGKVLVATVPTHGGDAGGPESTAYATALADGISRELSDGACGAVVDLRGNGGGDMGPMVAGLSALLPDGEILWFDYPAGSSAVTLDHGTVQGGGASVTVDPGQKADVPVAVLVDESTASSGEATMLTFRGLESSRSFGRPTAGYASANNLITMPDLPGMTGVPGHSQAGRRGGHESSGHLAGRNPGLGKRQPPRRVSVPRPTPALLPHQ